MRVDDISDRPESPADRSSDSLDLERRLQQAGDVRAGTFRHSDTELGGEVRTSAIQAETCRSETVVQHETVEWSRLTMVQAEVYRPDGTSDVAGTARYAVSDDAAIVQGDWFIASNYGVESALLNEIDEQARAQGLKRLLVWVPDGDPGAP